jgi:hypothetical protein
MSGRLNYTQYYRFFIQKISDSEERANTRLEDDSSLIHEYLFLQSGKFKMASIRFLEVSSCKETPIRLGNYSATHEANCR